jgi:hypothetical protein
MVRFVQAYGLAGWLVRRVSFRIGGATGMWFYIHILVFLLPQPVRSRALFETCASDHP